jgi:hypothetical protein
MRAVLLVRQKYPKALREHRRPACGRVPSGAHVWRGPSNSLQSLRFFRSDMRRPDCHHKRRQPLRAASGADGGARPSQKRFPATVCLWEGARARTGSTKAILRPQAASHRSMIPFFCHPRLDGIAVSRLSELAVMPLGLGSSVVERSPKKTLDPGSSPGRHPWGNGTALKDLKGAEKRRGEWMIVMTSRRCMFERRERKRTQRVQRTPLAPSIAGHPSAARTTLRERSFWLRLS